MKKGEAKRVTPAQRVIDPSDPLHAAIERLTAGMTDKEAVAKLLEVFPPKTKIPPQDVTRQKS